MTGFRRKGVPITQFDPHPQGDRGLAEVCQYISFEGLRVALKEAQYYISYLKFDWLQEVSETALLTMLTDPSVVVGYQLIERVPGWPQMPMGPMTMGRRRRPIARG
jgi:hypothetical protein